MKKQLNGWQAVLLIVAVLDVFFAAVFGCGWLLSKAPWLSAFEGWVDEFHSGWWVSFGVHLLLSLTKLKEKRPLLGRIDSMCMIFALICLGIEGALRHAFDLVGI